jgi:hypothetical protein
MLTLLVVAVLPLAIAVPLSADQAAGPRPAAVVPENVYDFGVVQKGDRLVHSFVIRNEGDAVLEITEVKPSCGCTVAEFDRTIAPGGSGEVKPSLDTSNFKGPIAKSVKVFTNDAQNPQINLVIKANIKTPVEVAPGYARFVAVYGEPQKTSVQTIWSEEKPDLEILDVRSPLPFVKVSAREAAPGEKREGVEGRQWQLEVDLDSEAPVGPLADYVVVTTNHPRNEKVRIPVSGFVRSILSVTPRIADFGRREVDEPQTANLEIRNLGTPDVALGDISTDLQGLEAEIETVEEGRLFKLLITLQPGRPKGDFEGLISISTTSPKQPVVEVSVKGVVL